jgi:hypothetical protein
MPNEGQLDNFYFTFKVYYPCFPQLRQKFNFMTIHLGFVVEQLAFGTGGFLKWFDCPISITFPLLPPSHLSPFFRDTTGSASQHDINTEQITISSELLFCIREVPGPNLGKITGLKRFIISPTPKIVLSSVFGGVIIRRGFGWMIKFIAFIHSTR